MFTNFGGNDILFDKNYAVKVYAEEISRKCETKNTVEMCQEFKVSTVETIKKLSVRFGLNEKEAANYVRKFWKN